MKKSIEYAKDGAIILGIGNALLNALNQIAEIQEDSQKKFDWEALLKAGGKGALVGGAIGGGIGLVTDMKYSNSKPINASAILSYIAKDVMLNKKDPHYIWLNKKAEKIENLLRKEFKYDFQKEITRMGSTEDGTALNYKFDIDLGISFKKEVFESTENMYEYLFDFIEHNFKDSALVRFRRQNKSIGLIFQHKGEELKVDIVPIKMSSRNGTSGYMYLNNDSWIKPNSYKKTDLSLLKSVQLTPQQKEVFVLIKNWKQKEQIPISSHFLKILVFEALNNSGGKVYRDLANNVVKVAEFVSDTIMDYDFRSVENTNNRLSEIDDNTKLGIKDAFDRLIKEYQYHPNAFVKMLDV